MAMTTIPFQYLYLLGSLYFLAVWFVLFLIMPTYRRGMVALGLVFMGIGVVAEYLWWTRDWWHPATMTGTLVGLEDLIMSFTHIAIPALLYKLFFRRDASGRFDFSLKMIRLGVKRLIPLFLVSFVPTAILFYVFGLHSFVSTVIGMFLAGVYILARRKDLLGAALWSALLMVLIALPIYWIGLVVAPDAIDAFWNFSQITGIRLLGIPLEDIVWYALLGFFMGGIFEYLFDFRLVRRSPLGMPKT